MSCRILWWEGGGGGGRYCHDHANIKACPLYDYCWFNAATKNEFKTFVVLWFAMSFSLTTHSTITFKLLNILLACPVGTAPVERSFSQMKLT